MYDFGHKEFMYDIFVLLKNVAEPEPGLVKPQHFSKACAEILPDSRNDKSI
jgi:hypothetical protein